ncbi:MAG: hypothetical protein P8Y60_04675 [Calditrichota bacterium]
MEILAGIVLILLGLVAIKVILWVFKAGFFLITLPIKIIFGVVFGVIFFLLIPVIIFPAVISIAALLPVILIVVGIALLIKYAI